ncbi:MAG: His/Gly/Thr/Pro-type tRNA ligase C-terminal domain-containing protein, partial [Phycisphaerae bacterium]|nr:His/Gly/Thr/Pro-type tRNA ligase C-terminal domain-containing protein [Phycisphaerae bacterium]
EGKEPWYVIAVVRGDHEINESKLTQAAGSLLGGAVRLEMAPDAQAREDGFALGYVGPHAFAGRDDAVLVVDPDAAQGQFWAAGANEVDHHVKHFNWARELPGVADAERTTVADIRNAVAGDPSPKNDGGVLQESRGIEVGHVFKLGCKYSDALGLKVSDENQQDRPVIMGCYGIGVNRILAAAIESESGHDEAGVIWPLAIAPYHVVLTPIRYEGRMKQEADRLYDQLGQQGVEVLLDDRAERPGVKFKDADLVGIPLRITIGDKSLANEQVELKSRSAEKAEMVGLGEVVERVVSAVRGG